MYNYVIAIDMYTKQQSYIECLVKFDFILKVVIQAFLYPLLSASSTGAQGLHIRMVLTLKVSSFRTPKRAVMILQFVHYSGFCGHSGPSVSSE